MGGAASATSGRCRKAASLRGEDERAAALRELEEETGVTSVEVLAEAPGWLSYDLPDELSASRSRAAIAASGRNGSPCASPGATARSTSPRAAATRPSSTPGAGRRSELPALIVPFKRQVYRQVLRTFGKLAG